MKEYIEKLYMKLHEAMEKPVTLGSAEEVGLYAKTICRLEKLHGHHDEPEAATFDRETAMQWAANMQNADGTTGPHWTMEQTTAVAESMGIQAPVVPRWAWGVTMNMMYSDYYPVAVEFGLNRPEFYAALAKAFLLDKDGPGPEQKLMEYYEHIARSSEHRKGTGHRINTVCKLTLKIQCFFRVRVSSGPPNMKTQEFKFLRLIFYLFG